MSYTPTDTSTTKRRRVTFSVTMSLTPDETVAFAKAFSGLVEVANTPVGCRATYLTWLLPAGWPQRVHDAVDEVTDLPKASTWTLTKKENEALRLVSEVGP